MFFRKGTIKNKYKRPPYAKIFWLPSKNVVFTVLILIFLVMIIMQIVSIAIKNKADEIKKKLEDAGASVEVK